MATRNVTRHTCIHARTCMHRARARAARTYAPFTLYACMRMAQIYTYTSVCICVCVCLIMKYVEIEIEKELIIDNMMSVF